MVKDTGNEDVSYLITIEGPQGRKRKLEVSLGMSIERLHQIVALLMDIHEPFALVCEEELLDPRAMVLDTCIDNDDVLRAVPKSELEAYLKFKTDQLRTGAGNDTVGPTTGQVAELEDAGKEDVECGNCGKDIPEKARFCPFCRMHFE